MNQSSNRFAEIYSNNEWGHGSGEGSFDIQTKAYQTYLQNFLAQHKDIKSAVDMGCGDWQFSRNINWQGLQYHGYDVVPAVIQNNAAQYGKANIGFDLYSGDPSELPSGDLLLCKDVLQHLPDQTIHAFLPILSRYKYALLTNCINPKRKTVHSDIASGDFRYLDLRLAPFNLDATPVLTFNRTCQTFKEKLAVFFRGHSDWKKLVLLVDNSKHT